MSRFRRHAITGEWILVASQRSERPNAFGDSLAPGLPCPFCPGNEALTPPEILRIGTADTWTLRVFPNKYPAVDGDSRDEAGNVRGGAHEVVVEWPDHDVPVDALPLDRMTDAVAVYIERYRELAKSHASVSIFKNDGTAAGASIPHIHSQIIALPFIPIRTAEELSGFRAAGHCPLCALVREPVHRIRESESFVVLAPAASRMPYEQWILPRTHAPDFAELTPASRRELALHLQTSVAALRRVMPALAFNWAFHNFRHEAAHWYLALFPRLTLLGGFELGGGTAIEVVDAAVAAEALAKPESKPETRNQNRKARLLVSGFDLAPL